MNYILTGKGVVICTVPKCGSQSMVEALMKTKHTHLTKEGALSYDKRVAFIRDPFDRLEAVYSHFWHIAQSGARIDQFIPVEVLLSDNSYEQFIDYIFENDDDHWLPQSNIVGVANTLHPIEDADKLWYNYAEGTLPRVNSWSRVPHNPYRQEEIMNYYRLDIKLREDLWH